MEAVRVFLENNPKNYKFEHVSCYQCNEDNPEEFISADDDLTGKPGKFRFVKCGHCGFVYQNPRIAAEQIQDFYDDEYIAHRKKTDWGWFNKLYQHAMESHDRAKEKIIRRAVSLNSQSRILDCGCAVGSFLEFMHRKTGCLIEGVDFKDLRKANEARGVKFHRGLVYETELPSNTFDLVTMWHFLEHDYDPRRSLAAVYRSLKPGGHLVIEVPRLDSFSFRAFSNRWPGLQAPQHTVLFDKEHFIRMVENEGFLVKEYLPWGAFPAYFYVFAGVIFKFNSGKGVNLDRVMGPYFAGQALTLPVFAFEKWLNVAMQTLIVIKPELN
jgi:2-polyprenyl-3-methyl-5-hydroxy-6-metoxy-1,4-benzoquinol methylase